MNGLERSSFRELIDEEISMISGGGLPANYVAITSMADSFFYGGGYTEGTDGQDADYFNQEYQDIYDQIQEYSDNTGIPVETLLSIGYDFQNNVGAINSVLTDANSYIGSHGTIDGWAGLSNDIVVTANNPTSSGAIAASTAISSLTEGLAAFGIAPPAVAAPTPLETAIAQSDVITIGSHHVYLGKDRTPEQDAQDQALITALQNEDAAIGNLSDDKQLLIVESWVDSAGLNHNQSYVESGKDFKDTWYKESFAVFSDSVYGTIDPNHTGRGGAYVGDDPYSPFNIVTGFSQKSVSDYYASDPAAPVAALEYLLFHETAHNTYAGILSNNYTGEKVDTTADGTPNHANENLANTIALTALRAIGLNLDSYALSTFPNNGWQSNNDWYTPSSPPPAVDPGTGGGYTQSFPS